MKKLYQKPSTEVYEISMQGHILENSGDWVDPNDEELYNA